MKNIVLVIFILIGTSIFSQNAIEKKVSDFKEVKVFDKIQVTLFKSSETKVSIRGERKHEVKILDDEDVLIIRLETSERLDGEDTFVEVFYTDIEILDTNEGSVITSKETLTETKMTLRAQEGAEINVPLDVELLDIKSVSGGKIYTTGKATAQDININSGGKYFASKLITETTELNVTAGGIAEINATVFANVKVTAGGTIKVFGNPKKIKKRRFAGGKIKVID